MVSCTSRPIGSKFEMVRPYYSTKQVHHVLGPRPPHHHPPPPPPPPPPHAARHPRSKNITALRLLFWAVLKSLSLSPNDSVAVVMLENEALLYAFVLVLMERVFACDLL